MRFLKNIYILPQCSPAEMKEHGGEEHARRGRFSPRAPRCCFSAGEQQEVAIRGPAARPAGRPAPLIRSGLS